MSGDVSCQPPSGSQEHAVVTELNIYPVKSCQAVSVQSVVVDKLGFSGDRRLMIVDSNNRFLHQRKFPQLATVRAVLNEQDDMLTLSVPGKASLTVDVCRLPRDDRPIRQVTVWDSALPAVDQGDEAAQWLEAIFESSASFARLVALPQVDSLECCPRPLQPFPASLPQVPDRHVAFADKGSVLVISEESLADLNTRFQAGWKHSVPMNRFRPNIVISGGGAAAFDEDRWLLVQIGSVPFMAYDKATRCKMTAVDQQSGQVDKIGPLEVLRSYRAPRGPAYAEFGQFVVPLQVGGTINVGDSVVVLEYKKS